jgi:hypothetical protein
VSAGTRTALRLLPGRSRWSDERELTHAIHGTVVGAPGDAPLAAQGWPMAQAAVTSLLVLLGATVLTRASRRV